MFRTSRAVVVAAAILIGTIVTPASAAGSGTGRIAFARQLPGGGAQIFIVNPDGSGEQQVPVAGAVEDFGIPVWSPDSSRLLITNTVILDADGNCCVAFRPATLDPDGSNYHLVPASDAPGDMFCHVWSADASRLFCGFGGDHPGVFSIRASDGGDAQRLTTNPVADGDLPWSLSPDGRELVFLRYRPGPAASPQQDRAQQVAIDVVNVDGTDIREVVPYGIAMAHEFSSASWSRDGKQIASSTKNGRLFVVRAEGGGMRQLSLAIGTTNYFAFQPAWSPDGQRLVFGMFINGQEDIYTARPDGSDVVRITNTPAFEDGPDWGASR